MYISDLYEDDLEISVKVVIVGNGAVGKSSMIQRYCRGIFTRNYKKTIGVDFLEKQLRIGGEEVRLMLWDTAGQEEFDAITKAYYRGAQACVVAFSTVDRASFDAVMKWKKKVEDECGAIPMVLVQNKIDLVHEAEVYPEEVERLAKEFNMRLYRTSVKEDLNVDDVFQHLAENYVNKIKSFNDLEANIGYPANSHEPPLHQAGMSHLGNSMGLNIYGTNSSARQLIQIGASSSSISRPFSHNTQQRMISVGAPRTNGYYKRNSSSTGYRPTNGYTGIGGYNADISNQLYSSSNGLSTGHPNSGNRYSQNHIVTNGSMNNNNERSKSVSNFTKHIFNQHKNNEHHYRASSSSGSSSNSIKVGNNNEGQFFQQLKKNNKDQNSSQFTKSIGMSNSSNGVGYSSFSPQDYLNNPMFDSLNASRHRRYWPTSGGASSDRTITLRPLMSTPKRNVHKRFQLTESCKVL